MTAIQPFAILGALLSVTAGALHAENLTPVWVELGPGKTVLARVVVSDEKSCPAIIVDGISRPMTARLPVPAGFRPAC